MTADEKPFLADGSTPIMACHNAIGHWTAQAENAQAEAQKAERKAHEWSEKQAYARSQIAEWVRAREALQAAQKPVGI